MAFSVTQVGNRKNSAMYKEYTVDNISDIDKLPTSIKLGTQADDGDDTNYYCAIGSKALVIETGEMYILSNDNQWRKIATSVGSSGSGSGSQGSGGSSGSNVDVEALKKELAEYRQRIEALELIMPTPIPIEEVLAIVNALIVDVTKTENNEALTISSNGIYTGAKANVPANSGSRCTDDSLEDETLMKGAITVEEGISAVFNGVTFTEGATITLKDNTTLILSNCRFVNTSDTNRVIFTGTDTHTRIEIRNCYFGTNANVYHVFELYGNIESCNISDNYFADDACKHNIINLFGVADGAKVNIDNNVFEKSANAIRLGMIGTPNCTVVCTGNTYNATDSNTAYAGLMIIQPYKTQTTSFAGCTVHINKTTHSDSNPVYYLFAGDNDTKFTDSNKPKVYIDGTLAK